MAILTIPECKNNRGDILLNHQIDTDKIQEILYSKNDTFVILILAGSNSITQLFIPLIVQTNRHPERIVGTSYTENIEFIKDCLRHH